MLRLDWKGRKATVAKWGLSKKITDFVEEITCDNDFEFYKDDYQNTFKDALTLEGKDDSILMDKCDTELDCFLIDRQGKFDTKNCIAFKKVFIKNNVDFKDYYNIYDFESLTGVKSLEGAFTRIAYTKTGSYSGIDITLEQALSVIGGIDTQTGVGFYPEYIKITVTPIYTAGDFPEYIITNVVAELSYIRISSVTPVDGWVIAILLGTYVKPLELQPFTYEPAYYFGIDLQLRVGGVFESGRALNYKDGDISNVRSFKDLLLDLGIVSNFFNVAPDATAPNNEYYDFASKYCSNIGIAQSYDIIRASAFQDSFGQSGDFDFEKLMKDINTYFNTSLVYYPTENIVRLEHVTYFTQKGIEPTDYLISEINIEPNIVKSEQWQSAKPTRDKRHTSTTLKYQNKGIEEKIYKAELLLTDFGELWQNKIYEEKGDFKDFFVMLCLNENNDLFDYNDIFSIKSLVKNLHTIGRPAKKAIQDNEGLELKNKDIGIDTEIEMVGSLESFKRLHINNSVVLKEGIFRIKEMELSSDYLLKIKLKA